MRRSKDDKRVLRSGNGRQQNSRRKIGNRQVFSRRPKNNNVPVNPRNRRNPRRKRKSNGKLVFIMIVALIAFVIGAGIGVSLSFDNGNDVDDGPKYQNVTKEMTTNLNDTEGIYYDKSADGVDYNENETSQLNTKIKYSEE